MAVTTILEEIALIYQPKLPSGYIYKRLMAVRLLQGQMSRGLTLSMTVCSPVLKTSKLMCITPC